MKRVIIIGSAGSGKSTFARALAEKTGIQHYHLDMIWHKPDRTTVTREEFDLKLDEIMQNDEWIIDGNYSRTMPKRLEKCDTVFLLDYPLELCLASAASRIGTKREDLPWVEETFDEEFRQWIIDFPKNKLPKIYELLNNADGKDINIFKSRDEADSFLESMK